MLEPINCSKRQCDVVRAPRRKDRKRDCGVDLAHNLGHSAVPTSYDGELPRSTERFLPAGLVHGRVRWLDTGVAQFCEKALCRPGVRSRVRMVKERGAHVLSGPSEAQEAPGPPVSNTPKLLMASPLTPTGGEQRRINTARSSSQPAADNPSETDAGSAPAIWLGRGAFLAPTCNRRSRGSTLSRSERQCHAVCVSMNV